MKWRRITGFLKSFKYAGAGIIYAIQTQRNIRVHLLFTLAVIALGLGLRLSYQSWAILTLTIGFVLVAEMINTVVETVIDLVNPEYHPLAKVAKDVAAGGVLLCASIAVVVGLLILGPPLLARLGWQ